MVKVSIIIPTYNEEKHIARALESIKKQKFKDYEIIVSDSKSSDKTVEIAKKYGARIVTGQKRGPGYARNIAVKKARGDVLFFMDADSFFESEHTLDKVLKSLKTSKGGFLKSKPTKKKFAVFYFLFNHLNTFATFMKKPMAPGYSLFFDKKSFEKVGGFNEKISICEDYDICWRLMKNNNKIVYLKDLSVVSSPRRFENFGEFLTYFKAFMSLLFKNEVPKSKFKFTPMSEIKKGF